MAFWIVLLSIFISIFIILFLEISVKFDYDDRLNENFRLRIFLYNEKFGINLLKKDKPKKPKKKKEEKTKDKEKISFFEKIVDVFEELKNISYAYYYSKDFIRKRLILEKLNVNIDFGMSDAAKTGIATGAIWAVLYNIFAVVTKIFTVYDHKFNVEPDYNNEKFLFGVNGILKFKLVNIISIAFYVLIKYITVSKKTQENLKESI